ncbi:MAG: SIS domain-containing protein [Planctomycetota bacterium]|nr:SIS domain-containing protein [Planctomycetota bacterium]
MNLQDLFQQRLEGSRAAVASLERRMEAIAAAATAIVDRLQRGGTVYTCGNGGSAAEAMHLAEELIGRYCGRDRPPRRAVCLNADATALTCIANDFGYEEIFARQCRALVTEADVLVVMSTSGDSDNIVRALKAARENGGLTIGLLGKGGGRCRPLCDHPLIVDGEDSAHIQEAHLVIVHLFCEAVERPAC